MCTSANILISKSWLQKRTFRVHLVEQVFHWMNRYFLQGDNTVSFPFRVGADCALRYRGTRTLKVSISCSFSGKDLRWTDFESYPYCTRLMWPTPDCCQIHIMWVTVEEEEGVKPGICHAHPHQRFPSWNHFSENPAGIKEESFSTLHCMCVCHFL